MDQPRPIAALGEDPIRTISRDELRAKLDRGDRFTLIMALNRWAFDAKHIPGSVHFDTPEALYAAVKPEDEVVVYCSQVDCLSSVAMYRDLVRRGYRNVRRYSGGLLDWEDAGLPLEGEMAERNTPAQYCQGRLSRGLNGLEYMTSVDLITTMTFQPGASPSFRADSAVMAATTSWPPSTSTATSDMTAPSVTVLTIAGSWFRALILIEDPPVRRGVRVM